MKADFFIISARNVRSDNLEKVNFQVQDLSPLFSQTESPCQFGGKELEIISQNRKIGGWKAGNEKGRSS
jgi:hypothetical protein